MHRGAGTNRKRHSCADTRADQCLFVMGIARMGRRILLADDDEQVHDLVQYAAGRRGHEVLSVVSGQDVTRAASDAKPDIVILDLGFPDADGRDLLKQLKANPETAGIPVLVWSGRSSNSSDRRVTLELGAEDYLVKDDPVIMLGKVERVLLRLDQERAQPS